MNSFSTLSDKGIIFNERPDSVPYNYRISYRVSVICLIIKICSPRKGCSLVKLHIVNDSMEKDSFIEDLKRDLRLNTNEIIIRFDPALNRALAYALSEKLIVQQANRTYKLTNSGREFVSEMLKEKKLLKNEKEVLEKIHQELDEETLNKILERWRVANA